MNTWDESDRCDDYMGRWSEPIAQEFLDWLGLPTRSKWVDVGCGPGALTATIAAGTAPTRLAGIDPSPGFMEAAGRRLDRDPGLPIGDAQSLPFESNVFDAAVSGIALDFFPEPETAVREMGRVAVGR